MPLHLISQDGVRSGPKPIQRKRDLTDSLQYSNSPKNSTLNRSTEYGKSFPLQSDHDFHIHSEEDKRQRSFSASTPAFKQSQRVVVYDKHNAKHCGVVRWTGNRTSTTIFSHPVVGIEIVS